MHHIRKIFRLAVGSSAWLVTSSALAETGGVVGEGGHGRHAVPELDPVSAAGALAVIIAAVLVFYGARKRT